MKTRERVSELLKYLSEGLYEKEGVIRLAFLSAISGESIFLLGPPGVAKSLVARRMKFAFKDAKSFEYLMGRFSTPDEIFGPISIQKLKNEDAYERKVEGYLPDSEIVFLDEIWKASPAIQNSLLTSINEKIYRNGTQTIKIKLKLLIAASNELPAKNESLEALWDRFLIRLYVGSVSDDENFKRLITDTTDLYKDNVPENLKIDEETYNELQQKIKEIVVPEQIQDIILKIRKKLYLEAYDRIDKILNKQEDQNKHFYISDRRWRKIVNVLRTSALLNGRNKVSIADLILLPEMLWNAENTNSEEEIKTEIFVIKILVLDTIIKEISDIFSKKFKELEENLQHISQGDREKIKIIRKPKVYKKIAGNQEKDFVKLIFKESKGRENKDPLFMEYKDYDQYKGKASKVKLYREKNVNLLKYEGMYEVKFLNDFEVHILNHSVREVEKETKQVIIDKISDSTEDMIREMNQTKQDLEELRNDVYSHLFILSEEVYIPRGELGGSPSINYIDKNSCRSNYKKAVLDLIEDRLVPQFNSIENRVSIYEPA